ncbi:MAG: hypothetical protein QOJ40_180, partial [Verrucomicrobiota bacterium]
NRFKPNNIVSFRTWPMSKGIYTSLTVEGELELNAELREGVSPA